LFPADAAFIEKLSTPRARLDARQIDRLCAIEVKRTGFKERGRASNPVRRLGNSTWILGVKELKKPPNERQQKRIDLRTQELNERLGTEKDDLTWIEWGKKSRFGRECRAGDTIIRIYNWRDRKRPVVTRRVRVLLKDSEPHRNPRWSLIEIHRRTTSTAVRRYCFVPSQINLTIIKLETSSSAVRMPLQRQRAGRIMRHYATCRSFP